MPGGRKSGTHTHTVNLAGESLHCPCHVCAFYSSADEQYGVLLPFVEEGIAAGERVMSLVSKDERADRLARLRSYGVDVDAAERNGQLEVEVWEEAYLRGGRFDTEEMLGFVQEAINTGRQRGFPRTRDWANMEWALTDAPGVEQLPFYESRLNFILPLYNEAVVCAYDVTRFPALLLEHVARAHPYVLADGFVQANPYYIPPEELFPDVESRKP